MSKKILRNCILLSAISFVFSFNNICCNQNFEQESNFVVEKNLEQDDIDFDTLDFDQIDLGDSLIEPVLTEDFKLNSMSFKEQVSLFVGILKEMSFKEQVSFISFLIKDQVKEHKKGCITIASSLVVAATVLAWWKFRKK